MSAFLLSYFLTFSLILLQGMEKSRKFAAINNRNHENEETQSTDIIMKKIFFIIAMMLSALPMSALYVTKFLGIPVDGTKTEMIDKLNAKGFVYHPQDDYLSGEFNGTDVIIRIATNSNKVWRIIVCDKIPRNETDIKIRFNTLCRQFSNKKNYIPYSDKDYSIPQDEDISYEMTAHSKKYEAGYMQLPNKAGSVEASLHEYLLEEYTEEEIADTVGQDIKKLGILTRQYVFQNCLLKSNVWFTINEFRNEYYISLFYDNEFNKADGEDL